MDKPLVGIIYTLANGKRVRIDVSIKVKELLEHSDRETRSQRRQDKRRLDFVENVDELDTLTTQPREDIADLVCRIDSYKPLYAALKKLPVALRRMVILYHFNGLTYREIADIENVHYSTVSRSINKALKILKQHLTE